MRQVAESAEFLKKLYSRHDVPAPKWHVVLGSGFASGLATAIPKHWTKIFDVAFSEMPGMPQAKVHGHAGRFIYYQHAIKKSGLLLQAGRIHGYEGHPPDLVTLPVVASVEAGCGQFLLTNAAGSLKRTWPAGSLMVITDHFNATGQNPLVGPNLYGERFPDLSEAYDRKLSKQLKQCITKQKLKCNEGVYIGVLGPSFETPAEVKTFSKLGFGAVGMSTVWEAISLKHCGATVVGLSYLSNLGCGLAPGKPLDHVQILKLMESKATAALKGVMQFVETAK